MSSKSLPQTFNPPGVAPPTKPTFSHASVFPLGTAKVVTIMGQIGTFPGGSIPPDFPSQVSNALRNAKTCLTAAGAAPSNIMSNTHYVVNYDPTDTTKNALFVEFLDGYRPPGTLVPVEMLAAPQLLFEIDVMLLWRWIRRGRKVTMRVKLVLGTGKFGNVGKASVNRCLKIENEK
jgi:monoamine oxidase